MADIATALYEQLSTDGGVSAIVGTRIYPLRIPQDQDAPAIAYQIITDAPYYSHGRPESLYYARIQLTLQAATYADVKTLQAAVVLAVHGFTLYEELDVQAVMIENQRDDHAEIFGISVIRIDVRCWYALAAGD